MIVFPQQPNTQADARAPIVFAVDPVLAAGGPGNSAAAMARTESDDRPVLAGHFAGAAHASMATREQHDRLLTRKSRGRHRWFPGLSRPWPKAEAEDKE